MTMNKLGDMLPTPPPEGDKRNIYQRLAAVIAESGAIAKTGTATIGGRYSFHQIDEVVDHLRPLMLKHGVIGLPSVLQAQSTPRPAFKDGVQVRTDQHAEASIAVTYVNVDDPQDRTEALLAWGEGLDVSDKAMGKATSYALKNHLLAMFMLRGQPDNEADQRPQTGQGNRSGPPPRQPPPPRRQQQQGPPPVPDPPWLEEPPPEGRAPAPPAGASLQERVMAVASQGNVEAAWSLISSEIETLRKKFPNLYTIKPQQVRVFYGKAQGAGVDVEAMKERVYAACGISGAEPGVQDHLELVPSGVVQAIFDLIEGGHV